MQMPLSRLSLEVLIQPQNLYGEMVWGLYEVGAQVSRLYSLRTLVPSLVAEVFSTSVVQGRIRMGIPRPILGPPILEGSVKHNSTLARRTVTEPRTGDEGDVVSRDDHHLTVSFQFGGRPLLDGQILTLFLRSMTFCSEHDEEELNIDMTAFSEDQLLALHIESERRMPGASQLSWERARLALRTLWMQVFMGYSPSSGGFLENPRFESLSYVILYRGREIGHGWIG